MKIILEGPDNSGKTTLAKRLAEDLDLEYRRPPTLSSTEGVNDHVFTWWEQQLNHHEYESAVYDRCTYISDPIYRLVSGHEPLRYEVDMMRGISQVKVQSFIIFCLPTWEFVKPQMEAEIAEGGGLEFLDLEHARIVHWAYFCAFRLWFSLIPERCAVWNYETQRYGDGSRLYDVIKFRIQEAM